RAPSTACAARTRCTATGLPSPSSGAACGRSTCVHPGEPGPMAGRPSGARPRMHPHRKGASILTVPSLYSGAFRQPHAVPATFLPRSMAPVAIRAFSTTTALGRGVAAQSMALQARRGGLRRNDFGPDPLPTWIGRVDGIEDAPLPEALAGWECRNNRLAWLALQADGLLPTLDALVARHGAERVALVAGTSTSSIGASEEGYARAQVDADGNPCFPEDLQRPIVHTPHSLGDFLQHATGLRGPCVTVATACSSSAKVFAQAARLIHSGVVDAALVGGVDTLCGSVLFG